MSITAKEGASIAVIGAGIGGISFGAALRRQVPDFENFTIYEKANDAGGTWRDNTYPGCFSDVPIHFFSLSLDLNPEWEYSHGDQPQIQRYWKDVALKYDLYPHFRFNTLVTSAEWDPSRKLYVITVRDLSTGEETISTANILVSALGILKMTRIPQFPGISLFKGAMFHSGAWNHEVNLCGKRVAVVGNGPSASQFVPVISKDPSVKVTQFCRTPNWYLPTSRFRYGKTSKWMFKNIPFFMRSYRYSLFLSGDIIFYMLVFGSAYLRSRFTQSAKDYMTKTAPIAYVKKLIPSYTLGCKRVIFDTGYLAALYRSNLNLNWDGISSFEEEGIVTQTGEKFPFDVVIFATGFIADDFPLHIRGTAYTMKEYYDAERGPKAYLGTTVPGFPNFYMISGPNTGTGHTSVVYTEEIQIDYMMNLIKPVIEGIVSAFEVTSVATDTYNDTIHAKLARSAFVDCVSWYRKGGDGKVTSIFPGNGLLFWWWLRSIRWEHYRADPEEPWKRHLGLERLRKALKRFSLGVLSATVVALVFQRLGLTPNIYEVYKHGF